MLLFKITSVLICILMSALIMTTVSFAQPMSNNDQDKKPIPLVRIAELEIYPDKLENYKAAAKELIETSVRVEPGVLTLYAVYEKDNPSQVRVFEIYADVDAYKEHRESNHFRIYKTKTQEMVRSLKLIDTVPIALMSKSK